MGSNMQRQAVPLLRSEKPLVGTGMEIDVARDSGACIVAQADGKVEYADADRIVVSYEGDLYKKQGGVRAYDLLKFHKSNQNSCFGQNNGVIQLTGVASRYVGFVVALMLIVLGLFPAVSGFVQHIPEPVLGGATLVMFGTIAASGVRIVSREPLNRRAIMIIALSLAVGLGVSQQPLILQFAPDWVKNLLSSGIAAGGITAIVLNLVFPPEKN